jgi:hypothetical protein
MRHKSYSGMSFPAFVAMLLVPLTPVHAQLGASTSAEM